MVQLLQNTWQRLRPADPLYPGSPGGIRRRWDKLVSLLGIPRLAKLTPASIRARGAIAGCFQEGHHGAGAPLEDAPPLVLRHHGVCLASPAPQCNRQPRRKKGSCKEGCLCSDGRIGSFSVPSHHTRGWRLRVAKHHGVCFAFAAPQCNLQQRCKKGFLQGW